MTMYSYLPADIGDALDAVDTPALLIDLDALERNLERMAATFSDSNVALRPHAKTHKSPLIGRKQMALGAVGVCCQKLAEAEIMVQGGVDNVLISNQVVGARKLKRLAALARQAQLAVCVDNAENVAQLDAAATAANVRLSVLIEVDVGAHRCGVAPGEPVLALAQQIVAAPGLHFAGLQAYQGRAQHMREFSERQAAIEQAVADVQTTLKLLAEHGFHCEIVAGAGTGTYNFEAASGVYNELQPGSYIFMDADYGRNRMGNNRLFDDFEHSLFVYTSVVSAQPNRAILDAGLKALSVDSGMPVLKDFPDIPYIKASDEHGVLDLQNSDKQFKLGDKLLLIPGHCDPTVNLYDHYVCIRNGRVEALWPIAARGAVL